MAESEDELYQPSEGGLQGSQDKITTLPGQPAVTFQQFSGYVKVDDKKHKYLFYYFAEAEIDPHSKPLVLWLNGARDNLVFMERWLVKFPQYRNRSLFIAGESYAGHYAPQLAKLMLDYNQKEKLFNLRGLTLGNPLLEFDTDFNSRAEFFWSHGLISDSTYKTFTTACNYSRFLSEYYGGSVSSICSRVWSLVSRETRRFVDKYDVTLDICLSSVFAQTNTLNRPLQVSEKIDVCVEDETTNYLNRKDVQTALHARLVGVEYWAVCSSVMSYNHQELKVPTISILGDLVKAGVPVLVYSGDQDSVIPLLGTRTHINRLAEELKLKITVPYRVWFEGMQGRQHCIKHLAHRWLY